MERQYLWLERERRAPDQSVTNNGKLTQKPTPILTTRDILPTKERRASMGGNAGGGGGRGETMVVVVGVMQRQDGAAVMVVVLVERSAWLCTRR